MRTLLAAPLAATLALAAAPPAGPPVPGNGLAWTLPAGWLDVSQQLTGVVEPRQQLAAASFPLRHSTPRPDCAPRTPPAGQVLVTLLEARDSAGVRARLRRLPPRPRHFRLRRRDIRPSECFGLAANLPFRAQQRAFQAVVMVGRRVPHERLAEAGRLLDSLVVERIPPPAPPARWPTVATEAGDGLSMPFGWRAAALAVPRRLTRPRLLFWAANHAVPGHRSGRRPWLGVASLPERLPPDGVALWIVERRRGPASAAFPPAARQRLADPRVYATAPPTRGYSVRHAGLQWRGYRFEVDVLAGPRATPRDIGRAFASAGSLGVSSAGRQCHAAALRRRADLCAAAARRLLESGPYMGVSCRRPNDVTCDRVGLAVWLRRPARRVTATIDGRHVALDDPEDSDPHDPRGPRFAGFLQPAGLRDENGPLGVPGRHWEGVPPRSAWVELTVDDARGRHRAGLAVPLRAGWG